MQIYIKEFILLKNPGKNTRILVSLWRMMNKKGKEVTIALMEIGGSHDECLLTQAHALKAHGERILLITNPEIIERNSALNTLADELMLLTRHEIKNNKWKSLKRVRQTLSHFKPKKVILNTAQGSFVRDLILSSRILGSPRTEWIGILHTTLKLKGSFTQKLISLGIKKYLLLSKDLLASIQNSPYRLDYFYPLTFQCFEGSAATAECNRIAIIGGVERRRKDLDAFMKMLKACKNLPLEFVFLGKSDAEREDVLTLKNFVLNEGLADMVRIFDEFVPQETMDAYLKSSSAILPLIHPDTPSAKEYFKNQIPGSMIMAFSYKIPLLIHEAYQDWEEMKGSAVYYNQNSFPKKLKELLENKNALQQFMKDEPTFDTLYQEQRFLDFVFDK